MTSSHLRPARINVKLVVILVLGVVFVLGGGAVAYKLRKRWIADEALAAGKAAVERQNWVEATKQLREYLSRYPDDPEILGVYGKANLAVRPRTPERVSAAIGAYRRQLRLEPDNRQAARKLIDLYISVRDHAEATYICRQRLEADPDDAEVKVLLAASLMGAQQTDEALDVLVDTMLEHPSEPETYVVFSSLVRQEEDPAFLQKAVEALGKQGVIEATDPEPIEVAEAILDFGVQQAPEHPEPLVSRARLHRRIGDRSAAMADLEATDALSPRQPAVLIMLFQEWLAHREFDKAEAELAALASLTPEEIEAASSDPDVLNLRRFQSAVTLSLIRGSAAEDTDLIEQASDSLPDNQWRAFVPYAVELHLAAGQTKAARELVDAHREALRDLVGIGQAEQDELALLDAAVALKEGDNYAVVNLLDPVVVRRPDLPRARELLAHALDKTGQLERATRVMEDFVQRWPGDLSMTSRLVEGHLALGQWREASKYLPTLEEAAGHNPLAKLLALKVQIYSLSDRTITPQTVASWRQQLDNLQEQLPQHMDVRVLQALVDMAENKREEAIARLERSVSECEMTPDAARLLATLYFTTGEQDADKAIEVAQDAVVAMPETVEPRLFLADLYRFANRNEKAIETLETAISELDGYEKASAQQALARFLIVTDLREEAATLLRVILDSYPADLATRELLLEIAMTDGDIERASKIVDEMREVEGERGTRWRLAEAQVSLMRLQESDSDAASAELAGEIEKLLGEVRQTNPLSIEADLIAGRLYELRGDTSQAIETYRRVVENDPTRVTAIESLMQLLRSQNRLREAADVMAMVPNEMQRSRALQDHMVAVALGNEQWDRAAAGLSDLIEQHPERKTLKAVLAAVMYNRDGDAERSLAVLDRLEKEHPGLPETLVTRVSILEREGRTDEAMEALNKAIETGDDFTPLLLRARLHREAGDLEAAEQDYVRLLTLNNTSADAYELLGSFYYRTGRQSKGLKTWEDGIERFPDDTTLRRRLIEALVRSPDTASRERGLQLLDQAMEDQPDDPELLAFRALALSHTESGPELQTAISQLQDRVARNPRDVLGHLMLIDLIKQKGEPQQVRASIERALQDNPNAAALYAARALLELEEGNLDDADEAAQTGLQLDTNNTVLLTTMARIKLAQQDLEAARSFNEQALAGAPQNEQAMLVKAAILDASGERQQAIEVLEAFLETESGAQSVQTLFTLAGLQSAEGQHEKAIETLNKAERLAGSTLDMFRRRLQLLVMQDDYEGVISLIDKQLSRSERPQMVHAASAVLLSRMTSDPRYLELAMRSVEQLEVSEPQETSVYLAMGKLAYAMGDIDRAETAYRAAFEQAPDNAEVLNDLAWIVGVERNRPKEAQSFIDRAYGNAPRDANILNTRGVILMKVGRIDDARRLLEDSLTVDPNVTPSTKVSSMLHLARIYGMQEKDELVREQLTGVLELDQEHDVLDAKTRSEIQSQVDQLVQ